MSVQDSIDNFLKGKLKQLSEPTAKHSTTGRQDNEDHH